MNVDGLIEGDRFTSFAGCLTFAGCEISDSVGFLISSRTISRIDFVPMTEIQIATGSDGSFDAGQKAISFSFGSADFPTRPKAKTVFVNSANMIHKRTIMSETTTRSIFGDHIKGATDDDRTIFVAAKIDQIVANCKNKSHFRLPSSLMSPCI